MNQLWKWLQGKKTSIGMISQSIVVYLYATGRVNESEAILITGILTALGISANVSNAIIKRRAK